MDSSTKETLYSLLNLIDYIESVSFISVDVNKVKIDCILMELRNNAIASKR